MRDVLETVLLVPSCTTDRTAVHWCCFSVLVSMTTNRGSEGSRGTRRTGSNHRLHGRPTKHWKPSAKIRCLKERASDWRARIQKRRRKISERPAPTTAERELEVAHYDVAERKATEEEMLSQIDSDFATSIGGVLQRLELAVCGGRVVAGFTRDDRPYLDGASYSVAVGTLLGPIPILEKMGRQIRRPKP